MTSQVLSRRTRGAALLCSAAAVCALAIPQAGSAADGPTPRPAPLPAAAAAPQPPAFVHLPADQAAHPSADSEWWYTVGHLYSHGHEYGYEVELVNDGKVQLSVTDVTGGQYYTRSFDYEDGQYSISSQTLDVSMPSAALSGPMNDMHLTATLPHATLDLHLSAKGPALYNNGNGVFPFLGTYSYYYSLPDLRTTGTLTVDGRPSQVTGSSWLDRQWGSSWDWTVPQRWTWMAVQLPDGEYINAWDMVTAQDDQAWATVLHRDGSQSVVTVRPLADSATDFGTSPTTGQRYAGRWTLEIPALKTRLTVKATPTLQEVDGPQQLGPNEAASTVTGRYRGEQVTGRAYVEQFGNWHPQP